MNDERFEPASGPAAPTRRRVLALGAAGGAALLACHRTWAQGYPSKPIRLMVASSPGGGVDITARQVAVALGEVLKTSIVVENKPGASGVICAEYVANSPPDGYTLMIAGGSAVVIAPQTMPKSTFNPLADLTPVATIGASPLIVSVHPSLGVKSLPELIALTRTRSVSFASAGIGTLTHLTIEMLANATKNQVLHVPYKGGGPALADALAGHVQGVVTDVPPQLQLIQEGRLVPLAVTSERRVEQLPNVPTAGETLPGFVAASWFGYFAPKQTPQAIVDTVYAALLKAVAREDIVAQLRKGGVIISPSASPDAFRRYVAAEYNQWGKLIREKNIVSPN